MKLIVCHLLSHDNIRYFIPMKKEKRTCEIASAALGTLFLCCVRVLTKIQERCCCLCFVIITQRDMCNRASQNFRGYLPHSGLSSEWPGATLVGVSESQLENPQVYSRLNLADLRGPPPVAKQFYYIEKNGCRLGGFQASFLKLLPDLLLAILMGVLSEAGSPENFGLPQFLPFKLGCFCLP